jgi:hypothetical protein
MEADMAYRVYSGPRGSETVPPLEKDSWLYKEFALLDEAMSWARHVNKGDRVALLIEGDDGTHLDKRDIAAALFHSEAELGEPEVQSSR